MMGAPESEPGSEAFERPQHQVTVAPFYLGKYPVTLDQWRAVMGTRPWALEPPSARSRKWPAAGGALIVRRGGGVLRAASRENPPRLSRAKRGRVGRCCRAGTRTAVVRPRSRVRSRSTMARRSGVPTRTASMRRRSRSEACAPPMPSASPTCTGRSGSGARTGGTTTTRARPRTAVHGDPKARATAGRASCAAAHGTRQLIVPLSLAQLRRRSRHPQPTDRVSAGAEALVAPSVGNWWTRSN